MNNRVFQVDRDCFLIFIDELSSRKEKFLRIGNSPYLAQYKEKISYNNLITPMFQADAQVEREGLSKKIRNTHTGLKRFVQEHYAMLGKPKSIHKSQIIYADLESLSKGMDEKEFIRSLDGNKKKKTRSYASFYGDGNIKIFDRKEYFLI